MNILEPSQYQYFSWDKKTGRQPQHHETTMTKDLMQQQLLEAENEVNKHWQSQ